MSIRKRAVTLTLATALAAGGAVGLGAESASAAGPAPQAVTYVPWISGTATPSVNGLRIRSGPGTEYTTFGLLYRGDHMTVVREVTRGNAGTWFGVHLSRRSASGLRSGFGGWVYAPYLHKA